MEGGLEKIGRGSVRNHLVSIAFVAMPQGCEVPYLLNGTYLHLSLLRGRDFDGSRPFGEPSHLHRRL